MRLSSYNIVTRKLANGDHVILNSRNGLLDLIDEEAFDLIQNHCDDDELSNDLLEEMQEVKDHFLERGFLTNLSRNDEYEDARNQAIELESKITTDKWGIVLIPNLGCNYRCPYCFEKDGGYPNIKMSKKQVDAIFNLIKDKLIPEEDITLYGGEPLQGENRELIEYIIHKGMELGRYFFTVTNGHDLEYYMDLLGKDKIRILQITMDGPRDIHNKRRISTDGKDSYDRIINNIERVLSETEAEVRLRINLDQQNYPYIMDLLDEFDKRGFLDNEAFSIGASPVVGIDKDAILHDKLIALEKDLDSNYPNLRDVLMGRSRMNHNKVLPTLFFGTPLSLKVTGCGASHNLKVFAPDGSIYSCWSCVGRKDHKIGEFDDMGNVRWNEDVLKLWRSSALSGKDKCIKCKYGFLCGGGCNWQSLPGVNDNCSFDCDYYYYRFDEYLARVTEEYLSAGN